MANLRDVISSLDLPEASKQKLATWLSDPRQGWQLDEPADSTLETLREDDLEKAGLSLRERRFVAGKLDTVGGSKNVMLRYYNLEDTDDYIIDNKIFTKKQFDRLMAVKQWAQLIDIMPGASPATVMDFAELTDGHEYIVDGAQSNDFNINRMKKSISNAAQAREEEFTQSLQQEIGLSGIMPPAVLMPDLRGIGTDFEFDTVIAVAPDIARACHVIFGEHRAWISKLKELGKLLSKPERLAEAITAGKDARKELHGKAFGLVLMTETSGTRVVRQKAMQQCRDAGVALFGRSGRAICLSQAGKRPVMVAFKPLFQLKAFRF